ncbi:MAG: hypothetical protein ABW133_16365 [Polyangiaceae bacterium]
MAVKAAAGVADGARFAERLALTAADALVALLALGVRIEAERAPEGDR